MQLVKEELRGKFMVFTYYNTRNTKNKYSEHLIHKAKNNTE